MKYAASLVAVRASLFLAGIATADVTSQNGIGSGDPNPVDVAFSETPNTSPACGLRTSGTQFTKSFGDIQRHNLTYHYDEVWSPLGASSGLPFPDTMEPVDGLGMTVGEVITNNDTGGHWRQAVGRLPFRA